MDRFPGLSPTAGAPPPTAEHWPDWPARLKLRYAPRDTATRMVERAHQGPLRVQKVLYPEGEQVAHTLLLHPPGGIAGGDQLALTLQLDPGAQALLTTPGAGKWYRADRPARQRIAAQVGAGAALEWLPQETILYAGSQGQSELVVDLAADAVHLGWDILCFGRPAAGESFDHGHWQQTIRLRQNGQDLWWDPLRVAGGDRWFQAPQGMDGHPVLGTFWAVGPQLDQVPWDALRALPAQLGQGAVTRLPQLLLVRYLGSEAEAARQYLSAAWGLCRPALLGRVAVEPRIWRT